MSDSGFRKSSHSGAECLEARQLPDGSIECRHSDDRDGARLRFTKSEWSAFVAGVKEDEFDF